MLWEIDFNSYSVCSIFLLFLSQTFGNEKKKKRMNEIVSLELRKCKSLKILPFVAQ